MEGLNECGERKGRVIPEDTTLIGQMPSVTGLSFDGLIAQNAAREVARDMLSRATESGSVIRAELEKSS